MCYFRYKEDFNNPNGNNNNHGGNSRNPSSFAYIAKPEILNDPSWLVDSSATNHMTAEAGNLMTKSDYNGNDSFIVGNATRLPIYHVGNNIVK